MARIRPWYKIIDTNMAQTNEAGWRFWVEESLRLCTQVEKSRQWRQLAASPLRQTPLIVDLLSIAEQNDPVLVGQGIYATLLWGVNQLKPTIAPDWQAFAWRAYNVLYYPYFAGMAFSELADRLQISEPTVYQSRRSALRQLVQILQSEAEAPQHQRERQQTLIGCQYTFAPQPVQAMLCLAAALPAPIELSHFTHLLRRQLPCWGETPVVVTQVALPADDFQEYLQPLLTTGALTTTANKPPSLAIAPHIGDYLQNSQAAALHQAHRLLANHALAEEKPIIAAWHYQQAEDHECAASLLLQTHRHLVNQGETTALFDILQSFHPRHLNAQRWAQIKLLLGDLALQQQDVQRALTEYQAALTAEETETRARAYYRRARAFLFLNLDETLWHYELALATLATSSPDHPLLNQIQTDKAWFFIQEKPDLPKAAALLQRLEQSLSKENPLGRSYLANAWAGYWHRCAHDDLALQHRLEAWLLANAAQDQEWMMHMARNLGNDYTALHNYDQALTYFARSLQLAHKVGDRAMIGLGEKAVGGCYFWQGDYRAAIQHYLRAYELLMQLGRRHWVASVCYDLAEAYAAVWNFGAMQRYWQEGVQLCATLRNDTLTQLFQQLDASMAWRHQLNQRQWQALTLIKEQGSLTNRAYQQQTGCQQRQAVRDLNELCVRGLVERVGQGRSVQYVIPAVTTTACQALS